MYVGETTRKLHERMNQHRSTIRTEQDCPVAHHFTKVCPNPNFLMVTPLEQVPITTTDEETGLVSINDGLNFLQREQFLIKNLNTMQPSGMNMRREIPPPIPFCIKYMDSVPAIKNIVQPFYKELQLDWYSVYRRHQFVFSLKRNKNLKDLLVRA